MRSEDVGPVPVVEPGTSRLVGLVTDRDIALHVVAAGRDPSSVRVLEIMSMNLVTCRPDDVLADAMSAMAEHQVRRIPVVSRDGSLVGIISQADVARYSSDSELGHVVEEISDASGTWTGAERTSDSSFFTAAACFAVGAAFMYLLDPDRGRRRRAIAMNKASRLYHDSTSFAVKMQRDLTNRAAGTVAELKSQLHSGDSVPDGKLSARVRSKMGRLIAHPHAVHVDAIGGTIILTGDILAEEVTTLLSGIRSVSGVEDIQNRLHIHETAGRISSLQGSSHRPDQRWDTLRDHWALAGAVGTGLALFALKTKTSSSRTGDVH